MLMYLAYGRHTIWVEGIIFVLLLAFGAASAGQMEDVSLREKGKIEALIKYVSDMSDAEFIRNGTTYGSKTAAYFLRLKWQANASSVITARDFIDKIASGSGTSGKPYVIKFREGREVNSREFLLLTLETIERQMSDQPAAENSPR